jgi:hypothetical protein
VDTLRSGKQCGQEACLERITGHYACIGGQDPVDVEEYSLEVKGRTSLERDVKACVGWYTGWDQTVTASVATPVGVSVSAPIAGYNGGHVAVTFTAAQIPGTPIEIEIDGLTPPLAPDAQSHWAVLAALGNFSRADLADTRMWLEYDTMTPGSKLTVHVSCPLALNEQDNFTVSWSLNYWSA